MMHPHSAPSAADVDSHTLKQWLHDGREIALLDVREHGQYGEAHLFYAAPVPYSRVVYDNGGGDTTAERAARALAALGYRQVHRLAGGIAQWLSLIHI